MKAPPDTVQRTGPITTDELCEIFAKVLKRKIDRPPEPKELSALAAALTAMYLRHLNPDENIVVLDLSVQQRLALRPSGMPLPRQMIVPSIAENWHSFAPDIIAEFRTAMTPNNPHMRFGKHFVARFLEQVIPRITGETPSADTIERWLKGPDQRKRHRPRTRR
jgi:hypothetical protein